VLSGFCLKIECNLIVAVKKNAEALLAAAKEIGLDVSADKAKYMVMSRDQNAA
jgi:hypothetical protein